MSDATLRLVQSLRQRLKATKRRIYLARLAHGGIITAGISAAALLAFILAEAYFWIPVTGRTILFWALMALIGSAVLFFIGRPLMHLLGILPGLSEETLARRIGNEFPAVRDRLINILHLADGRGSISDTSLRDQAIQHLSREVNPVTFEETASYAAARRTGRWAALPLGGLLLMGFLAPGTMTGASHRLFSPGTVFERPAPFSWTVAPGDSMIVKGDPLTIRAHANGHSLPRQATLEIQYAGEPQVQQTELRADSAQVFRYHQSNVRQSLQYRIQAGRVTSPWHTIRVANRPLVQQLQVSLTPPAYTGLPTRSLSPNVGDITALPGTRVDISVTTGGADLAEIRLAFGDGSTDSLAFEDGKARGSFVVEEDGSYHIVLRSTAGITNAHPITYQIETVADAPPSIEFEAPESVSSVDENGHAALQMHLTDDYGFHQLRLYYRLTESRFGFPMEEFRSIELPLERPSLLSQTLAYDWQIAAVTELNPVRGDVIEYFIRVWDNNAVAGYQSDKTATQVLRFPTLAQQYRAVDQQQESVASIFESLQEQADAIQEQFQALQEDIRRSRNSDWEDQRTVQELKERQQAMEEQVNQLNQTVESLTEKMQANDLVSEETLQLYQDLQEVIEEINSPELQEALNKLQQAMQQVNFEAMLQALETFEFNEKQYRQRLERTLELFEKIRTRQGLEEMARRMQNLAEQQKKLAGETGELLKRRKENSPDDSTRNTPNSGESSQNRSQSKSGNSSQETSSEGQQNTSRADSASTEARQNRLADLQEQSREKMEAVQKRMEELRRQMQELRQAPREQFEQLQQRMQQQNLPKRMQKNSRQLRNGQLNKAQQGQQSMQQQLQRLSQQLRQMKQSMRSRNLQLNIAGLREALKDVLYLSGEQEALRERLNELPPDSPALRDVSERQKILSNGLTTVADSLQHLAQNIPKMSRRVLEEAGEALRAMDQSVETITARELSEAGSHQKLAMAHLNELALDLSELLEQLQNMRQGGSSGMSLQQMLQQLQQMSGQQRQINQQIQQLLNDIQGNRLSRSQAERMQQIRRQQQAIRRQLEKMRNQGAGDQLLGDLERISEQMEETIRELREESVTRQMVERQQKILSRLLNAQQSLQTRGKEKGRTSETGHEVIRESPPELTPSERVEKLRRDLLRALETGYTPDYEELIKRYFQALQELSEE